MADSKIEWLARPGTRARVWNPVTGCTKVSEGCRNCYAERQAERFWPTQYPAEGRKFSDVWSHPDRLDMPLRWKTPSTVFVNSVSDLFHDAVPDEFIDRVFAVMAFCPQHTFIVLTKRPERMRDYLQMVCDEKDMQRWANASVEVADSPCAAGVIEDRAWPLPNVWLGVSIEDQRTANERIPLLLQTPAAVRVVSAEPLLGPVAFWHDTEIGPRSWFSGIDADDDGRIDWLIVGGESGPKARPCDVAWIRFLLQQGQAAGVPVFVKQLGAKPVTGTTGNFRTRLGVRQVEFTTIPHSGKGADPSEWPEDMRVREWPKV